MAPAPRRGPVVLSRGERARVWALYLAIGLVTVGGFVALALLSQRYDAPAAAAGPAVTLGSFGLAAYVLGLRHGVDADHLAAIDTTTRKLLQEGKKPLTVGTWFSLGHSTIVVGLIVVLVLATQQVQAAIPSLRTAGSLIGSAVSGTFLFLMGLINLVIVLEVYRLFQGLKRGRYDAEALEAQLTQRGFLNRYFGRFFRMVERPRQIYPIGVLFGLGFDTASEIAFIGIAVTAGVASPVPIWAVLVLPLLFTCGMVLVDTTDGITMRFAYGWAFLRPIRKIYYNLTIAIVSVLVAFVIGGIELLGVLSGELGLTGGLWTALGRLDFTLVGLAILAVFAGTWGVAVAYYRYKGYDRLAVGPVPPPTTPVG
jgi:nickel/cobalt transporter (NiCoT) family protein